MFAIRVVQWLGWVFETQESKKESFFFRTGSGPTINSVPEKLKVENERTKTKFHIPTKTSQIHYQHTNAFTSKQHSCVQGPLRECTPALLHHKWLKRTYEVLNFWNSRNLKSWSHLFKYLYITQLFYKRMFHNRLILRSDFPYQLRCSWRGWAFVGPSNRFWTALR